MKKTFVQTFICIILVLSIFSCRKQKDITQEEEYPVITDINELVVPPGFSWNTSEKVTFTITALDNTNQPISGARLDVFAMGKDQPVLLFSGITSDAGTFKALHPISPLIEQVEVRCSYIGLPSSKVVNITNSNVTCMFGGVQPTKKQLKADGLPFKNGTYYYMGTYDSQGVPDYLEPINDTIDAGLLQNINNALPEYQPVPDYHPEYLAAGNQTSLSLLSEADVWITFVHEGAGYKNVLGYFTYTTGSPPTTLADVDSITLIFPNVSFFNSGGGMYSGNKVYLGTFPANTSLAWVLIANAWQGGAVATGNPEYYSEPDLNPESNPDFRQHNVLLYDAEYDLVLIGFEDLNREGSCDNDFNDAIFYTSANPPEAIDITGLPYVDPTLNDGDGDGVVDAADDYPADPDKAFNHYYPGLDQYNTLSFEDQWPSKGDYDFNDLVIDFNVNQVTNASNDIVEIEASFTVKAVGAGLKNGYGFELPLSIGDVSNVTGMNLEEDYISLNTNNTEAGQTQATIVVFDNTYNLWTDNHVRHINTVPGEPTETPAEIGVTITLANPAPISTFDLPPYNPFVIIDGERGREVHLPDHAPTSLVNTAYFGTEDDDTNPAIGKYYKSDSDLPWGMHLPVSFDYPIEKKPVILGHLKFSTWVMSGGFNFMDWYENNPGYRNQSYIFLLD